MTGEVWGRVSVMAPLTMGFARATLVFTDSRVIVAHLGKRSSRFLLGETGKRLVGFLKSGGEERKRKVVVSSSPDDILASDPSNFAVTYDELVRVELLVRPSLGVSEMMMVTRDDKWLFKLVSERPPEGFEEEMRKLLGDRFSVKISSK